MKNTINNKIVTKSQAKEITQLLKKKKKLIKDHQAIANFKPPCALLIKRTGEAKWYENVTQGKFEIDHSEGGTRDLYINTKQLIYFPYADKTVPLYILHEDCPYPITIQDETIETDTLKQVIEKIMHELEALQAKRLGAIANLIWKILIGAALVLLAYALAKMLVPDLFGGTTETIAATAIQNITTNATTNMTGATITII